MTASLPTSSPTPRDPPAREPLILAAILFLLGITIGRFTALSPLTFIAATAIAWSTWAFAEFLHHSRFAKIAVMFTLTLAGAAIWSLNQIAVEPTHLARFINSQSECPITLRARILIPPTINDARTGRAVAQATEILTDHGWQSATGDFTTESHGGPSLDTGDTVEIYGWLSRPDGPTNPGDPDRRAMLAADRIFANVRIPRPSGIVLRESTSAPAPLANWLTQFRNNLAAKFLQHVVLDDVPAAYTLSALLLGQRDPIISDISQSFSDAGVAHLLAISGSHIVFFTAMVWAILRFLPLRPRTRDLLTALILAIYILATPCGPPIVRAGVALAVVLLARLSGRPAQHLNILAAAAILVVLLRPADIESAGFQLSFIATAGLILFGPRLYHFLFDRWLEREKLIVELSQKSWGRRQLRFKQTICALITANIIGAATAAPLVAFHFGQVNLWAVLAGLIAMPAVAAAMAIAALQLLAELLFTPLATAMVPITTAIGHSVIWIVAHLAALPGAALSLRPPSAWLIALLYAAVALWALRKRWNLSRAFAFNTCLAAVVITAAWYTLTAPVGHLQITVLDAGSASSILLRTPNGNLWALNAGAPRTASAAAIFTPPLRLAGTRTIAGLIITNLDTNHAGAAAELIPLAHPTAVFTAQPIWTKRHETLAGESLDTAAKYANTPIQQLHAGQSIDLGNDARADILWPPSGVAPSKSTDLILLCTFANHQILIADPASDSALLQILRANPNLRADAIIFTGQQRGTADDPLRKIAASLDAKQIIWSSRTVWAPAHPAPGEFNTQNGAVTLDLSPGNFTITQLRDP